ncbi:hypothetical protein P2318_30800 [Myxococcaceae bacterium GXIMD 01537]
MKKAFLSAVAASSLIACTSVETAVVSSMEIESKGEAVAVIQANALGLTAILHLVDIVQSDLDTVVNKLLVSEAKAMGATKVDLKSANTTPRHGIYALTGLFPFVIAGITSSSATGVAIK